ncbi:hypothetical protein [Cryptosporidium hominis TU502]|nr:hypothetical protein [Cryptosporidium hominis TU502]
MTFHQLIDSKTIPQSKNVDSNTFTGVSRNDENESRNLNINLLDENIENPNSSLSDDQFSQISILTQNDTKKDISDNSNINGNEEI